MCDLQLKCERSDDEVVLLYTRDVPAMRKLVDELNIESP
jgi:hypothetical protein